MYGNNHISINEYSYDLPNHRIAKYPLEQRGHSRLLEYKERTIKEYPFFKIPCLLPSNSLMFVNNTKVIHARLLFRRATGASVEIFCLSPYDPANYQLAFSTVGSCIWKCLAGNLKKWKNDILELLMEYHGKLLALRAEKLKVEEGKVIVRFSWEGNLSFGEILELAGKVPIPPYLNRDSEEIDNERYQTVYSHYEGSVAAPTAGFHYTPEIIDSLKKKNILFSEITLHVGAGTFQPIKSENALEHTMHTEHFTVDAKILSQLAETQNPVIATGTTSLRTLESIYWLALKSIANNTVVNRLNQWETTSFSSVIPFQEAFQKLLSLMKKQELKTFSAETGIMIVPGYEFRVVDILITNFHQPQSTLLLLIAAFIGEDWKKVYEYALSHDFRFLSYGDSSLLYRAQ